MSIEIYSMDELQRLIREGGLSINAPELIDPIFQTGGAETYKASGVIHADFATYTKAGATGVLNTYELPLDTLDIDGKFLRVTAWGTKTGAGAAATIQIRTGTTPTGRDTMTLHSATNRHWTVEAYIIRISSTHCDLSWSAHETTQTSVDLSSNINYGQRRYFALTTDTNWGVAQTIDFFVASINGGDSVTQEGLIIELLNN